MKTRFLYLLPKIYQPKGKLFSEFILFVIFLLCFHWNDIYRINKICYFCIYSYFFCYGRKLCLFWISVILDFLFWNLDYLNIIYIVCDIQILWTSSKSLKISLQILGCITMVIFFRNLIVRIWFSLLHAQYGAKLQPRDSKRHENVEQLQILCVFGDGFHSETL